MREISDIEELIRRWELLGHLEDHLIIEVDEANEPAALALARRLGKAYWNRMRPDRDLEEAYLELEYPGEENGNLSSKFFSSPDIVARNRKFKGVMAIKLGRRLFASHKRQDQLLEYILERQPSIRFILIMESVDKRVIGEMCDACPDARFLRYMIEYPTKDELLEYARHLLQGEGYKMNGHLRETLEAYIEKDEGRCSYREVESLVRDILYGTRMRPTKRYITKAIINRNLEEHLAKKNAAEAEVKKIGF